MTEAGPTKESRPSLGKRVWWFIEVLNVRLRFIFLMLIVGLLVGYWDTIMNYYDRWTRPEEAPDMVAAAEIEYYCPMHPNIIRPEPGKCPICGMPLSKRSKTSQAQLPEGVLARQQLTPLKVQMGRIGTTPIEYRMLAREIRTVGIVAYDETRRRNMAARTKGRIDKLMVNYVGQHVKEGDPLIWIYSPELITAQQELILAQRRIGASQDSGPAGTPAAEALIDATKQKLLLWGVTQQQIDDILRRGTTDTHLIVYAPISGFVTEKNVLEGHYVEEGTDLYTIADLSNVWMEAKIFEDESGGVEVGTAVEVTSTAYPNEVFAGTITFIAYAVDPATRTVSARVEIANPDLKLKPGMYAHAVIRVPVGRVTEVVEAGDHQVGRPPESVDTTSLVRAYLSLNAAFVVDRIDPAAVDQLIEQAQALVTAAHGATVDKAKAVAQLAGRLKDKDIQTQRGLLKELSQGVIQLVRASPPADFKLYVMHCPMVNSEWIQDSPEVANPFMGTEMPRCGMATGTIESSAVAESEQFATGYYCPIYPDRLFEKPETCPINKFPLKLARVEKVLAVPLAAVVNTGTRKVVYRETEPGTFDMLEVQVGRRAGEFYPLVSGLKPGDRVATAGAFLVDAENRLNPAASAQYFGASGGPQQPASGGAHQH